MKKVLALILAVLMVTSCMMFTVSAEEAKAEAGFKFIAVSDCDTTNGWAQGSVYADEKTQGNASIMTSMTGTTNAVGALALEYTSAVAKDVSEMTMLVFDLYISDVEALKGVSWELELRSVGGDDANELRNCALLADVLGRDLVSGWNHIELPLEMLKTQGTVDLTQWNYFRMYSGEGSSVTYGGEEDTVVAIDNMFFCNKKVVINSYLLSDFAGNGEFYTSGIGADATVSVKDAGFILSDVVVDTEGYSGASLLTDFDGNGEFYTSGNGATKIETWSGQFKGAGTYAGTGSWTEGTLQLANVAGAGTLDANNYFRTVITGSTNAIGTYTYSEWLADTVAIQLDVYVAADGLQKDTVNITAGDLYIGMALATGMTDSWGFSSISSAQLKSGQALGNGWYRVQLPLPAMGAVNIAQLYALRFDSNVDGNVGVTYDGNFVVKVDNICAVLGQAPDRPSSIWNELTGKANGVSAAHNATTAMKTGLHFSFDYPADSLVNTADYATFGFDVHITDVAANDIIYQICMRDSDNGAWNGWNNNAVEGTLKELAGYELTVGWNHVDIDLSRFGKTPSKVWTSVAPQGDPNYMDSIRWIKMANVGGGTNTTNAVVSFANVGFSVAKEVVEPEEPENTPDVPASSIWNDLLSGNRNSGDSLTHNATTAKKAGLCLSINVPNGNFDMTPYATFDFDVYITDVAANDIVYQIAMKSGSYWNGWQNSAVEGTLSELAGKELTVGLNHVSIDLSRFAKAPTALFGGTAPQGGADMTAITEIKMANVGGGTNTTDVAISISNITFCVAKEVVEPEEPEVPEVPEEPDNTPDTFVPSVWNDLAGTADLVSDAHNANMETKKGLSFVFNVPDGNFDLTPYVSFEFDVHITDVAANDIVYQIAMKSGAYWNGWQNSAIEGTLSELAGYELTVGWNHVSIDLARFGKAPSKVFGSMAPQGGADMTAITEIKMANVSAPAIGFETRSDLSGVGTNYDKKYGSITDGYASVASVPGAGGLGSDNYFLTTLTGMAVKVAELLNGGNKFNYPDWFVAGANSALQMDVYMAADGLKNILGEEITAADLSIGVSLAMGAVCDWNFSQMITACLKDGQDLGDGWYRVTLPLSTLDSVNLQQLYAIRFHGNVDANNGVTYTGNFEVRVDNIRFLVESDYVAPEPEEPNRFFDGRHLLSTWDYESGIPGDLPWNKTKNVTWAASFKGQGADFNGQVAAQKDGYLIIGSDTDGGTLAMDNYFLSTIEGDPAGAPKWMDDPLVDSIQIDVKIDATGLKKDGKDMDVSDLAINWGLQTDAGQNTSARSNYSRTTFTLKGAEELGDGWYRVTIPATSFSKYKVPGYSGVNMLYMDFRSDVEANVGVTYDSLTVAIDNIAVIPAEPEQGGDGEIIDVEKPQPDNFIPLFNVDDVSAVYPTCTIGWPTPAALLGDIDGDGDDEYILANYAGGGENKGNAGFNLVSDPSFDFTQLRNVKAISMDVRFLQDGYEMGTDVITLNLLGGGTPNSYDATNARLAANFMAYRGVALGNGWYRVVIPADEFTYTASDIGNAFAWKDAYNMYITFANRAFGDTLQVAVDNIGVLIDENAGQVITPAPAYASIEGAKLVLTDNFGLNFRATIQNAANAYVEISYNGNTTVVEPQTVNGVDYTFAFDGILAHQLGDTVSATIYAMDNDGKITTASLEGYSVKDYCYRMLEKYPDSTALTKLLNAVLNYGAAAQVYGDYNTDALVNAAAPGYNAQHISRHTAKMLLDSVVTGEATDDKVWKSASLLLDSSMTIRYYFAADSVEGLTVNVAKNGSRVDTVTEFGFNDEKGLYYVDVPVNAGEYNAVVTVDFGGSYAVNYSVNHYLAKNYGVTGDATFDALLNSIFCYGYQSRIYSGNSGV